MKIIMLSVVLIGTVISTTQSSANSKFPYSGSEKTSIKYISSSQSDKKFFNKTLKELQAFMMVYFKVSKIDLKFMLKPNSGNDGDFYCALNKNLSIVGTVTKENKKITKIILINTAENKNDLEDLGAVLGALMLFLSPTTPREEAIEKGLELFTEDKIILKGLKIHKYDFKVFSMEPI